MEPAGEASSHVAVYMYLQALPLTLMPAVEASSHAAVSARMCTAPGNSTLVCSSLESVLHVSLAHAVHN